MCFDDGRVRHNVPRTELLSASNWECDVWNEQIRLLHGEETSTTMPLAYQNHCKADSKRSAKKRTLHNINESPIATKLEHFPLRKSKRLSPRLTFQELFYHRCRTCPQCSLPDCGECESCRINCTTTSIHRQVCIIHMCSKIPIASKQQLSIYGWNYYFDTPQRSPSISNLHPCYQQVRLIAPLLLVNQCNQDDKARSRSIFTALHALPSDEERVKFGSFFEELTGQPLHERCSHSLTSKGYMHEYSNRDGTRTILSGTITKCLKHFIHRTLSFTIKFDAFQSIAAKLPTVSPEITITNTFVIEETVSEQMAWGGYQKYCRSLMVGNQSVNSLVAPYYVDWMTPAKIRYICNPVHQRHPYLTLEFRNCLLRFEVKPSTIKGAGMGLFVKVVNGKDLFLQPGEMLDLGIYAPLKNVDIKSRHISLLKNLIYNWSIETWSFTGKTKGSEACIFDPTDDFTGTRNFTALGSILCYVNETCHSHDVTNVSAQHDPEGNVHYLLGHWEETEGSLIILSGANPLELLVRYAVKSYTFLKNLSITICSHSIYRYLL